MKIKKRLKIVKKKCYKKKKKKDLNKIKICLLSRISFIKNS